MSDAHRGAADAVTRFVTLLEEQGFHETTVDQLAQAGGISRATFFRKYGTKEDVVFADHAAALERLERLLSRPGLDVRAGLADGVQLVFRHTLDHAQRSVARHRLLQRVGSLRDRELSTSHRYERLFRRFLRQVLPEGPDRDVVALALAASVVAVHNGFLRAWLHDPRPEHGEELLAALVARVGWLCATFGTGTGQATGPGVSSEAGARGAGAGTASPRERPGVADHVRPDPHVVVLVQQGTDPAQIAESTARSVYEALGGRGPREPQRAGSRSEASTA